MIFIYSALLFWLGALSAFGTSYEPQDPLTVPGFVDFYNLNYDGAYSYFKNELKAHPNDPDNYNHLAQVILYRELFHDGALESELVSGSNPFLNSPKLSMNPKAKSEFRACIDRSQQLTQALLNKNPNDVHALYVSGVADGLEANYLFLVEKDWINALRDAAAANKANKQVLAIDPSFVDARMIVGLYEYVVGNLPFYMRMLGFIGGFHGDKQDGIRQIREVAQHGILNKYDAEILLAVIYSRERCPAKALPFLQEAAKQFPGNYLLKLEQVQMYSDLGNKNAALQLLDEVDTARRAHQPGYQTLTAEKVEYLRGNLLFWYNDPNGALRELLLATRNTAALDRGTTLLAWLRLGQTYDLLRNHTEAVKAYKNAIATAPQADVANEAKGYISNPYHRKKKNG